ncbi:MAG: SpoIIE family protein phosphatase [Candidatus Aminicenantes bacterium]|nr:MAG: SpoIIE family protein phosphatase [Candidatus Aminicenantes bacterium]
MNKQKNNQRNLKPILLAVIGIALVVLYFVLVMQSPTVRLLKPNISKEEILSKAESFFIQLIVDPTQFKREISAEIDEKLLQFVQFHRKTTHQFPGLTLGYWKIIWKDIHVSSMLEENRPSPGFEITFDFNGELIGFHIRKSNLVLKGAASLTEDDALLEAKYFLESLNIKTTSLVTTNKDIKTTGESTIYKFTLKKKENPYPHLTETYTFEIMGDRIVSYWWDRVVDPEAVGQSGKIIESVISEILMAITWLAIIVIIIVHFIRKLRRDELEFKRALWMGIGLAVLAFVMFLLTQGIRIEGLLLGGLVGVLVLMGSLILFPVAESCTREAWPEKLGVIDLLSRGKWAVRETGTAVLHSFFLTGVTVLLFGVLIFTFTSLDVGYLVLHHDMIDTFQYLPNAVSFMIKNLVGSLFIGFIFLSFWPGYLKRKIPTNKLLFILLIAFTFNLAGLHLVYFHPPYLGFILVLPIVLVWAYFVYKWDQLTILLSLIGVMFLLGFMLVLLIPDTLFSLQGMAIIIFAGLFFLLGVYLVFRPRSVKDYDSYVPEYVSRIAEKERFLKELEIARGVQMRFLPQKLPEFPSLEIVSLCQPAMEVGGDYYDFIQMDERYMSVLIGDVSGKGVSAAFYMTLVKGIIKTLSRKTKKPAALLVEANEIFYENAPRDVFITIIYGIFDLEKQTLTVASAGHNPLIACRHRTGKTEMINPKGIALGLDHGERYKSLIEEKCIPIEEKDVFVFYTDGVSEAMNTREEIFGEKRLRAVIEDYAHLSPQLLQEKIVHAVSEFSGKAPQHDDFTMVVIKVRQK